MTKKKAQRRLGLQRETLKLLTNSALAGAHGGGLAIHTGYPCISWPFSGFATCDSCDLNYSCVLK